MKAKRVTGLVSAGGISESFLLRMPALLRSLGPVKAGSLQVARRVANSLRAGFGVADYAALDSCNPVWLAVPDEMLEDVVRELAEQTRLNGKMVVLCESARDSFWLAPLLGGARVATLNLAEESDERVLIAEGHPDVIRELSRLAAEEKRKLITLRPGSKAMYLAGKHLARYLLLPWIAAAVESLRAAGFSRAEAMRTVGEMGERSLRGYGKAGRRAWSPVVPSALRSALDGNVESVRALDPGLAALYEAGIGHALSYFEKP